MKPDEILFVLGCRSGTTLVHKCLLCTGHFVNWGVWNLSRYITEAIRPSEYIRDNFPKVDAELLFKTLPAGCNLAKSPEFSLAVPQILEKLGDRAKFLVLNRDVEACVQSHVKLGWHRAVQHRFITHVHMKSTIGNTWGELDLYDPEDCSRGQFRLYKQERERALENCNNVLLVEFDSLMSNFNAEMSKIAAFAGIPTYLPVWTALRGIQLQSSARDISEWLN